jgi:hypothetical protein
LEETNCQLRMVCRLLMALITIKVLFHERVNRTNVKMSSCDRSPVAHPENFDFQRFFKILEGYFWLFGSGL